MKTLLSTCILFLLFCTNLCAKDGHLFKMKIKQTKSYSCILLNCPYTYIYEVTDQPTDEIELWSNQKEELDNVIIAWHEGVLEINTKHKHFFNIKNHQVVIKTKGRADMLQKIRLMGSGKCLIRGNISPSTFNIEAIGSGDVIIESLKTTGPLALRLVGSGDINIKQSETTETKCILIGSGDITLSNMKAEEVHATLKGSGDITLKGISKTSSYILRGSGDISASQLKVSEAKAELYGSGDIRCNADYVYTHKSGSGDIYMNKTAKVIKQ